MSTKIRVHFAQFALRDLGNLRIWYNEQGVPHVGERLMREIIKRIEALGPNPDMGRVVPEFGQPFLRELIHPPFRIVHCRDPGRVRIVRIWPSERLLRLSPEQR